MIKIFLERLKKDFSLQKLLVSEMSLHPFKFSEKSRMKAAFESNKNIFPFVSKNEKITQDFFQE